MSYLLNWAVRHSRMTMTTESADVCYYMSAFMSNFKMQWIPSLFTGTVIFLRLNQTPSSIETAYSITPLSFFFFLLVNVMRCAVCHQDCKQSDIIDNYFVKDTTEATSTSDEKAAQVRSMQRGLSIIFHFVLMFVWFFKFLLEYWLVQVFNSWTKIKHFCCSSGLFKYGPVLISLVKCEKRYWDSAGMTVSSELSLYPMWFECF